MPIDASIPLQVQQPKPINPLADVATIMQLKQAQALLPLKIQEAQTQQQESALRLQQTQRAINDQQAQDAAWKGALTVDDSGKPTIDRAKLTQLLPGHLVPLANETLDKLDKSREDLSKLKLENQKMIAEHGGGVGKFLTDSEYAPGAYRAILPIEVANGITTPQVAQQLLAQLDQADQADPTGAASKALVKKHADQLLAMAGPAFTTAQARAQAATTGAARESREAAIAPLQQKRLEQETTGTVPITPYQQAQLDAKRDAAERNPTEASLAMQVAAGKAPGATPEQVRDSQRAELALKRLDQSKREARPNISVSAPGSTASDPKDIAGSIMRGEQPPILTGLYREAAPVRAELARNGYDLATADRDWHAVQRHLSTLNGAQQERLRQAITFTSDSLDNIESLYKEWQQIAPTSGFKILNKATLAAAKQAPGRMGQVATNLESQINDLTSELGTVYKGGNASTDESLRLAAGNLKADWNEETFKRGVQQIRKNLSIRKNSILTSQPAGVSPNSPYNPPSEKPTSTGSYQDYLKAVGAAK